MSNSARLRLAISSVALACALAGCASPQGRTAVASSFGGKADGDTGLAMRALAALNSHDLPAAVGFAERAVARTPDDAGFRALLGNTYFAAGRFASAEAAYKDALTIYSNQPQVVLKLALVQIAQGKNSEAAAFLEAARAVLQPADYGLALALSGRATDAVEALRAAAREPSADSRVRQNLALAHALTGDWTNARVVAAQDLAADQVDARVQQWMKLASSGRASDQVAALTGVAPAAADPGQPVRLALRQGKTAVAIALASQAPQPRLQAQPQSRPQPHPQAQPQPLAVATSAPEFATVAPVYSAPIPTYGVAYAVPPAPPPANPARVADDAALAGVVSPPAVVAEFAPPPPVPLIQAAQYATPAPAAPPPFTRAAAQQRKANLLRASAMIRSASLRRGGSTAVVQLGAFGSPQRVLAAWTAASRRYSALRAYAPMSASFASSKGKVYRLSVRGFADQSEATALCKGMRRSGGSCFVRTIAGDTRIALR